MIDPTKDELHHLTELAHRFLPKPPGPTGLWRWHNRGVLVNGRRVRLETIRVGRNRYTTEAAFKRFIEETNPAPPLADVEDERRARVDAGFEAGGLNRRPRTRSHRAAS